MSATPLGANEAQKEPAARKKIGEALIKGGKIQAYCKGVCYDTAAYTAYMLGSTRIKSNDLAKSGEQWLSVFKFKDAPAWDGKKNFKKGQVIGFWRKQGNKVFHAAIATGVGANIRGVNGFKLSPGWNTTVDLKKLLGTPDSDGCFDYDRAKIKVHISKV